MANISENARKITTFLLAVILWLHAFFFLNFQSTLLSKATQLIRLTFSEIVLFGLLIVFSFVAGSGVWKGLRSIAYIYVFPFVVLFYGFWGCFLVLRILNRWFVAQGSGRFGNVPIPDQNVSAIVPPIPVAARNQPNAKKGVKELLLFLLRPFRKFTFLWCFLLLVSTHTSVVWLCLIVVLFHLAHDIFRIVKMLFFTEPWLNKIGDAVRAGIETAVAGISVVTPDCSPTPELKNLWNQLNLWTKIVNFLKEPYLMSRWAWVLGVLVFGSIYTYIAVLFSCAYYGIARVSEVAYSWSDALITSFFIPFFVSDLPKVLGLRLLGGLQCVLVLAVGIGTLVNFIRRRVRSIQTAATDISNRLASGNIREKFLILEAKMATVPTNIPSSQSGKLV
jgi:hypothetical protein